MIKQTRSEAVASLNGFLYAISSFSGKLRDFENSSFCIEICDETQPISDLINGYYYGQYKFLFDFHNKSELSLREVEVRIKGFLIRDEECIVSDRLVDLQNYLSFRLMDMIEEIFDGETSKLKVIEVYEKDAISSQDSTFFCILSSNLLLVLQFNSYGRP